MHSTISQLINSLKKLLIQFLYRKKFGRISHMLLFLNCTISIIRIRL